MRKDLKAFVRVDASNRVIPGSMVLRKRMPGGHNGTWLEIQTYVCCIPPGSPGGPGAPITVAVPAIVEPNTFFVTLVTNGVTETVDTGTTTGAALVTYLQTNYPSAGTYVLDGTNVIFTPATDGIQLIITADTNVQTVTLPTLTGPLPNYHIEIANGGLTTGDVNTSTTTPATLITYLTTNYATEGTYTLNVGNTAVYFTPDSAGTTLAITAGA